MWKKPGTYITFYFVPYPFKNFPFPFKTVSIAWLKTNGTPYHSREGMRPRQASLPLITQTQCLVHRRVHNPVRAKLPLRKQMWTMKKKGEGLSPSKIKRCEVKCRPRIARNHFSPLWMENICQRIKPTRRKEVKKETKSWSHQLNPSSSCTKNTILDFPVMQTKKLLFQLNWLGFCSLQKKVSEGHIASKELIKYKQPENPD